MNVSGQTLFTLFWSAVTLLASALIVLSPQLFTWPEIVLAGAVLLAVWFLYVGPANWLSSLASIIMLISVTAFIYPRHTQSLVHELQSTLGGHTLEDTTFKDCATCPELLPITPGAFTMGSPENERGRYSNEGPTHQVNIGHKFAVGKFSITVDEFKVFVHETGYDGQLNCIAPHPPDGALRPGASWRTPGFPQIGLNPVTCVSWYDANAYVQWLSKGTRKHYRLLSEAEREYVARAGTATPYWWGDSITQTKANYETSENGWTNSGTVPVNSYEGNPWGLFQVHGNVFEWTADCWHQDYAGAPTNSFAWSGGDCSNRVVRGGSWVTRGAGLRSALRGRDAPDYRANYIGFRVARALDDTP